MAKFKCDICGKESEGYGNNPAPLDGKVCCDKCNETYVIPARLKQIKVSKELKDAEPENNEDTTHSFNLREHIGSLIKDEVEAIEGYDKALKEASLSEDEAKVLEELRNDEIDHVNKLNNIYKGLAKGAVEKDTSLAEDDDSKITDAPFDKGQAYFYARTGDYVEIHGVQYRINEDAGKIGYSDMIGLTEVKTGKHTQISKKEFVKEARLYKYSDSAPLRDEKISGPRGTFEISTKSRKELEQEGYGYHHEFEKDGEKFYVLTKNNTAVACKDCDEVETSVNDAKMTPDRMVQIITPIVREYAKKKGVGDYWKIHKNGKNVSVGIELGYRSLDELCDIINRKLEPITESYFEPADAGLIETTIFDSNTVEHDEDNLEESCNCDFEPADVNEPVNDGFMESVVNFAGNLSNSIAKGASAIDEDTTEVKDSDVNIPTITVGQVYRWDEKYGNRQLMIKEVSDKIKLQLGNTNGYVVIPVEKFELFIKNNKLVQVDATPVDGYDKVKVSDAEGVFAFGWDKGVMSGDLHPSAGTDAVIKLDARSRGQWKAWAVEWARKKGFKGVSVGRLESHDPDNKHCQSIIPLIKF